ncbi:MAG: DUF2071 domain-containing protein [Planctomycetota bacterium]
MLQSWRELLFLHWRWDPDEIQATLPPGLTVDTHEGDAYLGLVPFLMRNIRPRFCPPVPGISNFLEINVRTYVYDQEGRPGVWFYSLDADQWLAVRVARTFFNLPYHDARMAARVEASGGETSVDYRTRRRGEAVEDRLRYAGLGDSRTAKPGSLEHFLAERYRLFASDRKECLWSGRVHHDPYPLRDVRVEEWSDQLLTLNGFDSSGREPDHALFSEGVHVRIFALERVK